MRKVCGHWCEEGVWSLMSERCVVINVRKVCGHECEEGVWLLM